MRKFKVTEKKSESASPVDGVKSQKWIDQSIDFTEDELKQFKALEVGQTLETENFDFKRIL